MAELATAHTSSLPPSTLRAIRLLLDDAFDGDVTEHDYEHALGGVHALLWDGAELIAHGSVIMRRLLHEGRSLRTGYVEAVAVRADRQRSGHGAAVMAALEQVIQGAYEIGALAASDQGAAFYAARGWQPWSGTASVITPNGIRRTEEDEDCIYLLPMGVQMTPSGDLACDWRDGDVW